MCRIRLSDLRLDSLLVAFRCRCQFKTKLLAFLVAVTSTLNLAIALSHKRVKFPFERC